MKRFYFTFGSDEKMPFQGGWVEILADDIKQAALAFKAIYPNNLNDEVLNCDDYYTEEQFVRSGMFEENRGKRCHALIIADDHVSNLKYIPLNLK